MLVNVLTLIVAILAFIVPWMYPQEGPKVRAAICRRQARPAWVAVVFLVVWTTATLTGANEIVLRWRWDLAWSAVAGTASALWQHGDVVRLLLISGAVAWIAYVATREEQARKRWLFNCG